MVTSTSVGIIALLPALTIIPFAANRLKVAPPLSRVGSSASSESGINTIWGSGFVAFRLCVLPGSKAQTVHDFTVGIEDDHNVDGSRKQEAMTSRLLLLSLGSPNLLVIIGIHVSSSEHSLAIVTGQSSSHILSLFGNSGMTFPLSPVLYGLLLRLSTSLSCDPGMYWMVKSYSLSSSCHR